MSLFADWCIAAPGAGAHAGCAMDYEEEGQQAHSLAFFRVAMFGPVLLEMDRACFIYGELRSGSRAALEER